VSILGDPKIVDLFKRRFIPVAVDQHVHRRRKDAEGELFTSVLKQAGRGLDGYAQGFYIFTPAGKLLEHSNTVSGDHMKKVLASALKKFDPSAPIPKIEEHGKKGRPLRQVPEGGMVVTVTSKVLGGYGRTDDSTLKIRQEALGRDHLWVRKDEVKELCQDTLPKSLKVRIARFHLVDNTRGEPPFWKEEEIKRLEVTLRKGALSGVVHLETKSGDRGFDGQILGQVETKKSRVTRFDVVVKGNFWGEGTYTNGAPKGRFPFAVAFTLSEGKGNERWIPPGGARSNVKAYLERPRRRTP
jgi:hypothetical protein